MCSFARFYSFILMSVFRFGLQSSIGILLQSTGGSAATACSERDFLAITRADDNLFENCFLTDDWSWKLSFQDCLISQIHVAPECAIALREAAFPTFISGGTCQAGDCEVKFAIQRAVASWITYTELTSDECTSDDLSKLAALENTPSGGLPVSAPSGLTPNCSACLAGEVVCPDVNPGDVCHSGSPSAVCMGCKQINAAKQVVTCSIPLNTNSHAYDCSAEDLEHLTNFSLSGAVECFADIIGWQGAVEYCLYTRGVSPACSAYMASHVFASEEDQGCVNGIGPDDEASTNTCLIPMWIRGTSAILLSSSVKSTITRVETCTDTDLATLSAVTGETSLTATLSSLTTPCRECVGADPAAQVETECAIYCDSTHAGYEGITWACSACVQFESVKTLTNCNIGETSSAASYTFSSALVLIIMALLA